MEKKRKELEKILAKKYGRLNDETTDEILALFSVSISLDEINEAADNALELTLTQQQPKENEI